MKFKTIVGLVMGAVASVFVFFGTVLGKGAWTEMRDMKKKKAEPEKPAEEAKTEEKPAEEEKTEE